MSAPRSPRAAAAAQRVLAGEQKAAVARDTGVSRATIDRHLAALGHPTRPRLKVSAGLDGEAEKDAGTAGLPPPKPALEEVAAAGVTQLIVVSACSTSADPHHLRVTPLNIRHRLGEFIAAAEAAALRDAVETARLRFDAVYVIRPTHNALGPFDCSGAYDRTSERRVSVAELIRQGHDDASRQFIEPVVGASGERLARPPAQDLLPGSNETAALDPVARRRALAERLFGDE